MDYQAILKSEAYDFLRTEPHIKDRLLFLTVSGSHAYGTNVEGSDLDIRGVALDTLDSLIGMDRFEQFVETKTDTTIYSLSKFSSLAQACNPNVIELLFVEPRHILYLSPIGKKIFDNRAIFLSQRAIPAFGGYANDQLNRLENALMREDNENAERIKIEHIKRSLENCMVSFLENEGVEYDFSLNVDEKEGTIKTDFYVKGLGIGSFRSLGNQMGDVLKTYSATSLGKNARKDDLHLNKHMMHLVRLYLTANELLEFGTFHTYREKDRELLLSIREGKYRNPDGSLKEEFHTLLKELSDRFDELKAVTPLPKRPNREAIASLLKEIYGESVF